MLVTVIMFVAPMLGLDLEEGTVSDAISGLVQFVGFILMIWGQLRRKDLTIGMVRR